MQKRVLQKVLLEAVSAAVRPEDATAAAVAKIFPAAVADGKVSSAL